MLDPDIFDDVFHGCAFVAYLDEMAASGVSPPDCEATRQRAFRYYEEAIAEKIAETPESVKSRTAFTACKATMPLAYSWTNKDGRDADA